jgi:hypothetical protein
MEEPKQCDCKSPSHQTPSQSENKGRLRPQEKHKNTREVNGEDLESPGSRQNLQEEKDEILKRGIEEILRQTEEYPLIESVKPHPEEFDPAGGVTGQIIVIPVQITEDLNTGEPSRTQI